MISEDLSLYDPSCPVLSFQLSCAQALLLPEFLLQPPNQLCFLPGSSCAFHCIVNAITRQVSLKYPLHQGRNCDPLNTLPWDLPLEQDKVLSPDPLNSHSEDSPQLLLNYFLPYLSLLISTVHFFQAWLLALDFGVSHSSCLGRFHTICK